MHRALNTGKQSLYFGKRQFVFFCCVLLSSVLLSSASFAASAQIDNEKYESQLLDIVEKIQQGELTQALNLSKSHLQEYPKSRVGHLLQADILSAQAFELDSVGKLAPESGVILDGLKHQIRSRWTHRRSHQQLDTDQFFPSSLVDLGGHSHVIVADMKLGRLYLYANQDGQPELVKDYYLTVGSAGYGKEYEGDNKTPVGVYSIYKYIDPKELPDLYGKGAFPVDYPNRFDRFKKRTGYGIWLHGTPSDTVARSPWASEGCFVLSNSDFLDISQFIDVDQNTPVVLSDSIEWISKEQLQSKQKTYHELISQWQQDWESLNTKAYLQHYSSEVFNFGKGSFNRWASAKESTNQGKTFVQVDMDIQSLFEYPGEKDMFVLKFRQHYLSNNYQGQSIKEQYWRKESDGRWRIVYEG